jgi:hypothetical protein
MIPEEYVGLLIGTGLTLFVSFVSMILTNYFSERRWRNQREFEQKDKTVQDVYSPLYFFLENLTYPLVVLKGSFKSDLDGTEKQIMISEKYLQDRARAMRKQIDYKNLQQIIEKKLAVLKPPQFRAEIIGFMQLLRFYEESFDMIDFDEKQSKINEQLEIIGKVTVHFLQIISGFRDFLLKNILDEAAAELDEISYTSILTEPLAKQTLQELIKFTNPK